MELILKLLAEVAAFKAREGVLPVSAGLQPRLFRDLLTETRNMAALCGPESESNITQIDQATKSVNEFTQRYPAIRDAETLVLKVDGQGLEIRPCPWMEFDEFVRLTPPDKKSETREGA